MNIILLKSLFYFMASFLCSFIIIEILIKYSSKLNLIDHPDYRKIHSEATPVVGGLGIIITFVILILFSWYNKWELFSLRIEESIILAIASFIIILTGLIDDLRGLKARDKFLFQIIAAVMVVVGISNLQQIDWPLSELFDSTIYNSIMCVFYIISILNAINLIDGLDGLAGGVSIIITTTFVGLSILSGGYLTDLFPMYILLGSLVGFMYYNKPPARTFLGDTGSLFIGWFFALSSLLYAQKTNLSLSILLPIMVLGLPAFDVIFVMLRRFSSRHNYKIKERLKFVFQPDNSHLHHMIMSAGFSKNKTLVFLYLITAFTSCMALVAFFKRDTINLMYSVIFILFIIFIVRFLFTWRKNRSNKQANEMNNE